MVSYGEWDGPLLSSSKTMFSSNFVASCVGRWGSLWTNGVICGSAGDVCYSNGDAHLKTGPNRCWVVYGTCIGWLSGSVT